MRRRRSTAEILLSRNVAEFQREMTGHACERRDAVHWAIGLHVGSSVRDVGHSQERREGGRA
jgi:hypothetical protein